MFGCLVIQLLSLALLLELLGPPRQRLAGSSLLCAEFACESRPPARERFASPLLPPAWTTRILYRGVKSDIRVRYELRTGSLIRARWVSGPCKPGETMARFPADLVLRRGVSASVILIFHLDIAIVIGFDICDRAPVLGRHMDASRR